MPNLSDLVLWGVPLIGLVAAIVSLLKWLVPALDEKIVKLIGAALTALGAMFIFSLDDMLLLWPWLEVWGQRVLWALTLFLMYTGHYPLIDRLLFFLRAKMPTEAEFAEDFLRHDDDLPF